MGILDEVLSEIKETPSQQEEEQDPKKTIHEYSDQFEKEYGKKKT